LSNKKYLLPLLTQIEIPGHDQKLHFASLVKPKNQEK